MRARLVVTIVGLVLGTALLSAQARRMLDIYVVDVEGGNATLFVTPAGEWCSLTPVMVERPPRAMRDASSMPPGTRVSLTEWTQWADKVVVF